MAECVRAVKVNSESLFCSVTFKFSFIYNPQNYTLERAAFGTAMFNEDASSLKASMLLDTAEPNPENGDSTLKAGSLLDIAKERLQNGAGAFKASSLLDTAKKGCNMGPAQLRQAHSCRPLH